MLCSLRLSSLFRLSTVGPGRVPTHVLHPPWNPLCLLRPFTATPTVTKDKTFLQKVIGNLLSENPSSYSFLLTGSDSDSRLQHWEEVKSVLVREEQEGNQELVKVIQAMAKGDGGSKMEQEQCLSHFSQWVGSSCLSVAYHLHSTGSEYSEEFLSRLIARLAGELESLSPSELVALMLMVYLRGPTDCESMFDHMSASKFQKKASLFIDEGRLSNAEVCALCLGLLKIRDFSVTDPSLRFSLYDRLYGMGLALGEKKKPAPEIDNLAIINMLVLVVKGKKIFRDEPNVITETMAAFQSASKYLNISAATKLMSFATFRNVSLPALTVPILRRLTSEEEEEEEQESLTLRESHGVLHFLSRSENDLGDSEKAKSLIKAVYDGFQRKVEKVVEMGREDENSGPPSYKTVSDLLSITSLINFHRSTSNDNNNMDTDINRKARSAILTSDLDTLPSELELDLLESLFKSLFPGATLPEPDAKIRFIPIVTQYLMSLSLNVENSEESERFKKVMKMNLIPLPKQVWSPRMQLDNLEKRMQYLIKMKRSIDSICGGESYSTLSHILPFQREPDLVIAHLGGTKLRIPHQFVDSESWGLVRRPPGTMEEWIVVEVSNTPDLLKNRLLEHLGYTVVNIQPNADMYQALSFIWSGNIHLLNEKKKKI